MNTDIEIRNLLIEFASEVFGNAIEIDTTDPRVAEILDSYRDKIIKLYEQLKQNSR